MHPPVSPAQCRSSRIVLPDTESKQEKLTKDESKRGHNSDQNRNIIEAPKEKRHFRHVSFDSSLPPSPVAAADSPDAKSKHSPSPLKHYVDEDPSLKVPPSLYFVNASVILLFFTVLYYLLSRWREKIRSSSPLHVLSAPEFAALLAFAASSVYLLGFFGVELFQSLLLRPPSDLWTDDCEEERVVSVVAEGVAPKAPCGQALDCETPKLDFDPVKPAAPKAKPVETEKWDEPIGLTEEDEEVIASVVAGTTPSYSLESKLGDCRKATAVRREALQRTTGKSLAGLPLEGFDYEYHDKF